MQYVRMIGISLLAGLFVAGLIWLLWDAAISLEKTLEKRKERRKLAAQAETLISETEGDKK